MRPAAGWRLGAGDRSPPSALAACSVDNSVGYVEIKTVPSTASPPLYLDSTKLEPFRNGTAVLRQKVGTVKLQIDNDGGQLALLCNVVVQKNRITSVTISVSEPAVALPVRPPERRQRAHLHRVAVRVVVVAGLEVPSPSGREIVRDEAGDLPVPVGLAPEDVHADLVGGGGTRRLLALDRQRPDQPDDGDVAEHQDFLDG